MEKRKNQGQELVEEFITGLYRWYPFRPGKSGLYVGTDDRISSMLKEYKKLDLRICSLEEVGNFNKQFDYIILQPDTVEKSRDLKELLELCHKNLAESGGLLFSVNNRLGIRYFCGDRDPYTDRIFDGLEDYIRAYGNPNNLFEGRCYDGAQVAGVLEEIGFLGRRRYSVFPDLENPTHIFADGYIPNENLRSRVFAQYNYPQSVFLEEENLWQGMIENGIFHAMANAFLFECKKEKANMSDALQVTNSLDRGPEKAMITVIHEGDKVTKEPAYIEGYNQIEALTANTEELKARGIPVVSGTLENHIYTMPLIHAKTGEQYLQELLYKNKDQYLKKLDEFVDLIKKSSDLYEGEFTFPIPEDETDEEKRNREKRGLMPWQSTKTCIAKKAFVDMVPLNSFYIDGQFVFFDQEFCREDYPLDYLIHRAVVLAHDRSRNAQDIINKDDLFARYGLPDGIHGQEGYKSIWFTLDRIILRNLRNERPLEDYYKSIRKEPNVVFNNREHMNYAAEDYSRLFENIFRDAKYRNLIIFGAGAYAKNFLTRFGDRFNVVAAIDNNSANWGKKIYPQGFGDNNDGGKGVPVKGPDFLLAQGHGTYKVIVCIKNNSQIMKQLNDMGIHEFSIYDPAKEYPLPIEETVATNNSIHDKKKYHIGYVSGAFDLFHIGHLNLLKRAKEYCDYLIVGVMSDEAIQQYKNATPFVTYDERAEIVMACKYVDQVEKIPFAMGGADEAWKQFHFDVLFCGSDYEGNQGRMREKKFLEEHGATVEIFPYTQSTSSSQIREMIEKKLV